MGKGVKGEWKDGRWALVDEEGNALTEYKYWFVEPCGEGYFRAQVTGGGKYNILTPDGKEIFTDSYNYISEIHNGIAICRNTVRKTKTTPTIYQHGILHVSGAVIAPPYYPSMRWLTTDEKDAQGNEYKDFWGISLSDGQYVAILGSTPVKRVFGPPSLPIYQDNKENFDWVGIDHSPCRGCIYSRLIPSDGTKCGRFIGDEFRYKVVKRECKHKRESYLELSEYDIQEKRNKEKAALAQSKIAGSYAHGLVKDFIEECLDGDISKITTFNFSDLNKDKKYLKYVSDWNISESFERMAIFRSLLMVLYGEAWPECNYEKIEKYKYSPDTVFNFFQMFYSAIGIDGGCEYVKAEEVFSFPKELKERVRNIWPRFKSLANYILVPTSMGRQSVEGNITRGKRMWREYPDSFIATWRDAVVNPKTQPYAVLDCVRANKKAYEHIKTEDDFIQTMKLLLLDDFINLDGSIPQFMDHIFVGQKGLSASEYLPCAERFLDHCEAVFDSRDRKIVEKLRSIYE